MLQPGAMHDVSTASTNHNPNPNPNSRAIGQDQMAKTEGKAIDPPPILQLLMYDFDPESASDMAEITSQFWVVYCKLISAQSPDRDVSTVSQINEDGQKEVQRLLLGTSVSSPTITSDDPDPPTFQPHPQSTASFLAPPSPTSRFLPTSSTRTSEPKRQPHEYPGAFFIFADISVRKAGDYRLQFTLMKMDAVPMAPGSTVAAVDIATSDVFRVVNAKDFDTVQASSNLVKGLLDRGAGFPLKLKKGLREGQKKRKGHSDEGSDDDMSDATGET
ncbi:hypothetical protein B0A52_03642 [Exophiala mesophila]|uniref:Velvet domain-containing protein n=1 Tax=Exophiala mesophila TaxID=212818 RepID=A0A438NA03_EXOME|nr:hypothetical protein B0A52_03642 [Exophiala mesophila]